MNRSRRPLHPGVLPTCPDCHGGGAQIERRGEHAVAELCSRAASSACPACNGTQWVRQGADRTQPVQRCGCHIFGQRLALYSRAGVPGRLAPCTFATYRLTDPAAQRDACATAQALAGGFKKGEINRGFVLWGPVGRGKTHLLAAALRQLTLEHGVACRFIEFSHLLAELKGRFDRKQGAAALLDELVEVEVLAIDELGKGMLTEWELSVIDQLVSRRYNAARTILATTNFRDGPPSGIAVPNLADPRPDHQPTLSDRVGERVYSRLSEMCDFQYLGGKDWRQRQTRSHR
ncbi:MAG: AFG1/ZapE family ATPase [Myxococcota bacterium]